MPPPRTGATHDHLPALDGVRGVAILAVLLFDFTSRWPGDTFLGRVLHYGSGLGWGGVTLFFVLSGYLITGILLRERGSDGYYKRFLARRGLRIFPLYYAVLFVIFVLLRPLLIGSPEYAALADRQLWLWTYTTNLGMAHASLPVFHAGLLELNHFWSLAVEEQFYVLWPAVIAITSRRALAAICIALILFAPALRFGLLVTHSTSWVPYVLTPCRADGLALGALAALVATDAPRFARWTKWAWPLVLGGVAVAAVLAIVLRETAHVGWKMQTIGFEGVLFASLGLVLAGASTDVPYARWLTWPALRFAGKYSYGAYVFHALINTTLDRFAPPSRVGFLPFVDGLLVHALLGIVLAFGCAFVSYHLFEKRFLALKRHFV